MDTKLKNNKLYVKLIIVMTILIASIGMVLSYQSIKKYSNHFGYNIYEDNGDFTSKLIDSTYGLYYKIYDENNEKTSPADLMLELNPGVDTNDEYTKEIRDSFGNEINDFAQNLNTNLKNLDYYVVDKSKNLTKKSPSGNLDLLDSNEKNTQENLRDKYQFYISIDFDDKGNMRISKLHGADERTIESNLNQNKKPSVYLGEDIYGLKPIKNMKFVYGVPKDLKYVDNISHEINMEQEHSYTMASRIFINIGIVFVILVAMIIPYKEIKELKIFEKITKIPVEVVAFLVYLSFVYAYLASDLLIIKTVMNKAIISFTQLQFTIDMNNIINYLINLTYWVVLFTVMFTGVILLKHIIKTRHTTYLKDHSLIYKGTKYINKKLRKTKKWMFDIELGRNNKKKIVSM
ncbi:MAG: hypothetical protein ACLTT7_10345, partial [Paraclostridium bifermentans]